MRLLLSRFASPTFRDVPRAEDGYWTRRMGTRGGYLALLAAAMAWALLAACGLRAQQVETRMSPQSSHEQFLRGRSGFAAGEAASQAMLRARQQHEAMVIASSALPLVMPRGTSLTAAWQPLGPVAVQSARFGKVSGRVTAAAFDANDTTGNTLYVGTTGGGVWKSTNAAGPSAAVSFTPLTDTLPVFAGGAGSSAIASLSIGAVAVQPLANPVVLAGTGDPNDATDSYYGEGILRSADGGLTWTLAQGSRDGVNGNHSFVGLSVAGIAWSTATPSLVVAALSSAAEGEIVGARDVASVRGLYYSTDAGVTWQMATLYDGASVVQQPLPPGSSVVAGNAVTSVVWNALRQKFYAAVRQHGFYESADGVTWRRMTNQPGTGLTAASCPVGVAGGGSVGCPMFRGALAVQAATADMYAVSVDSANIDNGLWQDLCAATGSACAASAPAWAHRIDGGALEVGSGSAAIAQGDYNLALAAVPSGGGTALFAGTVDLYRCVIATGGSACTLRNTTNALNGCNAPAMVAPAEHSIAAMPLTTGGPLVFAGNDGGLWRSLDGVAQTGAACSASDATHFDNLNGALGSLAEVVGFAEHPTDANTLLAGLGANGTAGTTASQSVWPQLAAGEGGFPLIDAVQPQNWYVATGAGVSVKQCTLGVACAATNFAGTATVGAAQVSGDVSALDAPTLLDPGMTANLIVGTCRVWRGTANGAGWSAANAISRPFGGAVPCTASSAQVRSVAAGGPVASSTNAQNAGSTVLYAGIAGAADGGGSSVAGHVFVTVAGSTANSTTAWTDAGLGAVTNDTANAQVFNPFKFDVSAVTVDTHDATGATVYATVMGFGSLLSPSPHVYRSLDFGAHWLNLSANLPDAPANALIVDPNDANTVYVALDTGVYVTTQIATCASANCWSVLGTGLPNAPVTSLAAAADMLTGDGRRGMLRAGTYGRGLWQMPLLSAISLAQPAMTFSAPGFTFPAQAVGTLSAPQTLTVTSNGNAALTVRSVTVSGDFVASDTCSGQTLAVGATCTVQIRFAPSATGTRNGLLTVFANTAGGQATATLIGTGTAPAAIVLTPVSLTFAATVVGQTTAAQIVTVANTGGTAAALQTPVVNGDFAISANTCGATLAASTSCSVAIAFTPTASGTRNGTLTLVDDAGTQTATLIGVGNAPATDTLAPGALTFATTVIGQASAVQQVTLTNAGDVALTLITATISSGPFTVVNGCGASLAAHAACVLQVSFVPTVTGATSGVLTVGDQFRTQTVALQGIGIAPAGVSLTPSSLSFAATAVGLTSAPQTMTLTNNGGVSLAITSMVVSGDFRLASTTCGTTLAVNASCALVIVFAPTISGARAGALTLVDNAPSGTQTAVFSGAGVDYTLTAAGATTLTIASGDAAVYPMLLSSASGVSGSVAFTCTGYPSHSACNVTPSSATLGGSTVVTVTIQTGLTAARMESPMGFRRGDGIVLAMLLPLGLLMLKRRREVGLLMLSVALMGCGAGRQIPAGGFGGVATPTPSGSYAITVSAVSAGITRSVGVTLVVK